MPDTTNSAELEDALDMSANYIHRVTVRQLLPAAKDRRPVTDDTSTTRDRPTATEDRRPTTDDTATATDDDAARSGVDHFDFNAVLPRLPHLEELDVTYGVRDCGMDFDWTLFQFTARDCRLLGQCVAMCRTLRSLTLQRSKVT